MEDLDLSKKPYSKDLTDRFPEGSFLKVTCTVKPKAESFTVKLLCPKGESFSLSADFKTHKVVLNSALEGKKDEAKTITNPFPFKRSHSFELKIVAKPKNFEIQVYDGNQYVEIGVFEYRTYLGSLTTVEVAGDLIIEPVEIPKKAQT